MVAIPRHSAGDKIGGGFILHLFTNEASKEIVFDFGEDFDRVVLNLKEAKRLASRILFHVSKFEGVEVEEEEEETPDWNYDDDYPRGE